MNWKKKIRKSKPGTKSAERSKYMDECHKLWSLIVRHRDGHTCQWCGSKKFPQAHHIVARYLTKGYLAAWYDITIGMTLCRDCHLTRLKALPDEYIVARDKFLAGKGLNYWNLRALYNYKYKTTIDHLKIIYDSLKQILEKME